MKLENIKQRVLIIAEHEYKNYLLKKLNESPNLLNINIISKAELIKKFYFSYDEKTIYYLIENYHIAEDIARIYLENLYFIENKDYKNKKLNDLVKIKQDLEEQNLLYKDKYFLDYIKDREIIFYKYNTFNKFDTNLIEQLEEYTKVTVIKKEENNYLPKVYEFDTLEEEVDFIAVSIIKLIEKGVSPESIRLTNIDEDYQDMIDCIFPMYGLKIDSNNNSLFSNIIVQEFLNREGSISEKIEKLNEKYKNSETLRQIVNIVNKYIIFENEEIINEMISNEFKKTKVKGQKYSNTIEVIDYKNYPITDEYIFLMGFNQNKVPTMYKDEDYITDNLKKDLIIDTTLEKNKREKQITISNLLNIKNLTITYKNSSAFNSFYPSNLISDLNLQVIKNYKHEEIYSKQYAKISLAKKLDNYVLYGTVTDELKKLYNTFQNFSYNKYDNKYKKIDKNSFLEHVKNGFNLSYSNMNDYYKCSFKYYLSNILKLNIYEDSFDTYIGSLFHYVLENGLKSNKNTEELIPEFIEKNDRELTKKEQFFIQKLTSDIDFALATIKQNLEKTDLKKMLFEERVEVTKNKDVTITFKGFIDKIMYDEFNGNTIVCIIDYKTGYTDIDLKYVPFGLSMQLPVYLYLAKNSQKLENVKFGGFYLQRVLNSIPVIDPKKDYEKTKKEGLLLSGFSNSNQDILEKVDNTYKNSTIIKSMKLDSKGEFSRYSKILNDEQINKLIDITDEKINEAIEKICNTEFQINPKVTDKENLGCKYCQYRDICFVEKHDEVIIKPDSDLSFLGGEENA